jgi:hypothetical protein
MMMKTLSKALRWADRHNLIAAGFLIVSAIIWAAAGFPVVSVAIAGFTIVVVLE